MNNQKLVEQLREWADKLAEMPEAGDAVRARLEVYDHYEFDELDAAGLLSGREVVRNIGGQAWVITDRGESGGVTIFTATEEKARQICPPVPLEDVQVPTEVLSGLSGQEVE